MKQRLIIKLNIGGKLCSLGRAAAKRSANTACDFWTYQEKIPDAVMKLKKH